MAHHNRGMDFGDHSKMEVLFEMAHGYFVLHAVCSAFSFVVNGNFILFFWVNSNFILYFFWVNMNFGRK